MGKQTKNQRSKDACTITISMPVKLRNQIDAAAEREQRTRSNYIVYELTKAVERILETSGSQCPASGCGGKQEQAE